MKPLFNSVQLHKPKGNKFDLTHEKKLSCNMGELIPAYIQEVIPGDKFRVNTEMLLRCAPMIAPMMHRVNVYMHYFFVPNRLVWSNWETYITGGVDGLQVPTFPTLTLTNALKAQFGLGTLADYLGIPDHEGQTIIHAPVINALPFRAYQLIWNEFYRDQTLQTAAAITKNDTVAAGTEFTDTLALRMRCWEKDYFTSAMNATQRGSAVVLPSTPNYKSTTTVDFSGNVSAGQAITTGPGGTNDVAITGNGQTLKIKNLNGVDITVNDLRRATRLQTWLEKNMLAGSRYAENTLAHFGVRGSDARLQRPEFLGGGKSPVVISEVVSTVKETSNPQGTMSGHGVSVGNQMGFTKRFEEHGFIIGILSTMPKTAYQQGIPRMFTKADRYDYFWPELAQIGEQAIKQKEIYYSWTGTDTQNNTFGYAPRYSEYKFNNSTVHGDFKSTLNFWHMGRIFGSEPGLNSSFVQSNPTGRIWAVNDNSDHLWIQLLNKVSAYRLMPVFGTPTL